MKDKGIKGNPWREAVVLNLESSYFGCCLSHRAQFGVVVLQVFLESSCSRVFGVVVLQKQTEKKKNADVKKNHLLPPSVQKAPRQVPNSHHTQSHQKAPPSPHGKPPHMKRRFQKMHTCQGKYQIHSLKETPKLANLRARSPSLLPPPKVPRHQLYLYAEARSESKDSASNTTHDIHVPKGGWTIVERVALLNCARKRRGVVQFPWDLAEGSV
ncbi:hypothetical protein Taro_041161 [Colocasia esculenta]|uniref:Uncharacterized protein n=1 Tax=Colocasia esculenta TaxID=4460 RepID=A0A843WKU5_COLES|nr:hypothetical protein [Colocasia esculenta]